MTYLQIILDIAKHNRPAAAGVYEKYKGAFLRDVPGAQSKTLLVRDADVQVLHGFRDAKSAADYLASNLFNVDVVNELKPLLQANPDIRIYEAA